MIVRPATLSDVEGIARAHVQSWRESYRELIPQAALDALSVERRSAQWRHTLGNPDRTTFVAEVEGALCGFASGGGILWSGLSTGSEVSALYLLDTAKRRGVGRAGLAAAKPLPNTTTCSTPKRAPRTHIPSIIATIISSRCRRKRRVRTLCHPVRGLATCIHPPRDVKNTTVRL